MIGKSGLLSILQFVAVIIPAFVVLMEIVISRGIGEEIEIASFRVDEIRLLEYSLLFLIAGTGLILYRLLYFINNIYIYTTIGVIFIFGSIPLSMLTLWVLSNRSDYTGTNEENISEYMEKSMKNLFAKAVILFLSIIGPTAAFLLLADIVNNQLSLGFFYNNSTFSLHQFALIGL